MRNDLRPAMSSLLHLGGMAALFVILMLGGARAHVGLTPANAPAGSQVSAHFRVGHGCNGSPTIALTVTIPPGVTQVTPQAPPGWSTAIVRAGTRTTAVTWKGGELAADKPGEFVLGLALPASGAQLFFPATQVCRNGQEEWNETPVAGATLKHPAPMLLLAAAAAAPSGVTVSEAWFRALPGTLPAGGYFILRNRSTRAIALTGAESPACSVLMMHKSESKGGMSGMEMVSAVEVAAGGRLGFAPGGYHLMCTGPKPALKPGATVPVTLAFQDGTRVTTSFAVRDATGK